MNSLNSVLVEGFLSRDPELIYKASGLPVCKFTIESQRFYKDDGAAKEEVSYFEVRVFSQGAVACQNTLTKSRGVRIVGRLREERCVDSEGKVKSLVLIIAEHVEFKPEKQIAGDPNG